MNHDYDFNLRFGYPIRLTHADYSANRSVFRYIAERLNMNASVFDFAQNVKGQLSIDPFGIATVEFNSDVLYNEAAIGRDTVGDVMPSELESGIVESIRWLA